MFKSLCDLPCVILCVIVFVGGGARLEFPLYIIKEEGSEEAAGAWGSRNWMMDYSMFFSQPDDGCHSLRCSKLECCESEFSAVPQIDLNTFLFLFPQQKSLGIAASSKLLISLLYEITAADTVI